MTFELRLTIKGSSIHNLKELHPRGEHLRILFVFDPTGIAILMVGGDKAGQWGRSGTA